MYIYKEKRSLAFILLSLFGFVLLWAAVLSTLFFVLLHWPACFVRYFRLGTMDYKTWIMQSITAAVWGIVFCWLLKKSKTIWNPIITHIVYDVFIIVFAG
ncbi:MAG: CPBP family intramembrane metalloprotease [Clostridiales bacterium]|nr:CPBP family intramembrane metalloprotease [Clostridiales bacterium]